MTLFNRKLALLGAAICIILAAFPIRWGLGDIQAYPVRYAVQKWQDESRLPSVKELSNAQQSIQRALWWQPDNPEYSDYQGRLYHYQALLESPDNQDKIDHAIKLALASYRQSIQLRPNWPYSWANLALMKALLKDFDAEYTEAIRKSTQLGPWENAVNTTLTEAGIIGWLKLTPEIRLVIVANIERGIRRNSAHIQAIIDRYNKRSLVCAYLKRDKYQKKLCGY